MTRIVRRTVLLAASAWVALSTGETFAQQAGGQASPGSRQGNGVEEVVVTATRRAEPLSKVAISVSAFTAEKMDVLGVKSFADLAKFTPGVTYDDGTKDISIRGIDSTAGSGTTGIYIDDTPIQIRNLGFNADNSLPSVFDLDRVEVLRGPQGTLFGAGSEGGTVRYITPQPSLTDFSGVGRGEIAFTQFGAPSYEAGAALGGPIIDDELGFRFSAWAREDGGWIDRANYLTDQTTQRNANGVDTYVVRGAVTWAPTSRLTITPAIDYQNRAQYDADQFWVALSDPANGVFRDATPDQLKDKDRFYLGSLDIHYDFDSFELISNSSYFSRSEIVNGYSGTLYNLSYFQTYLVPGVDTDPLGVPCTAGICATNPHPLLTANGIDLPGLPNYLAAAPITNTQKNLTQEVRLQSTDSDMPLQWVVGIFYDYNKQESKEQIHDPQLAAITQYLWGESILQAWTENLLPNGDDYIDDTRAHDDQIAGFADLTYALTDQWKIEAGVRVAHTHYRFVNFADGPQNFGPSGGTGQQSENPITPKASIDWQITPDDLVYATVAKGFRIGGANPPIPQAALGTCGVTSVPDSYSSDTIWSYELGTKDRFLDGRLRTDASLYYIDWSKIQQSVYLANCGLQYTANLGDAVSKGFDFQAQYQLLDSLTLDASVGYTDARYTSNTFSADGTPLVESGDGVGGSNGSGSGSAFISPWTVTLGGEYDFTAFGNDAYFRADDEYASKNHWPLTTQIPTSESYDPNLVADPSTNQVSWRAGLLLGTWDVSLFMENVLNAHPRLDLNHQDAATLLYEASTLRPRTTGVTVTVRY